jgi:protein-disulfide isomerase
MVKWIGLFAIVSIVSSGLSAQTSDRARTEQTNRPHRNATPAKSAPEITSDQAEAILEELRQIRKLLEKQQSLPAQAAAPSPEPPQQARMSVASGWYSLGRDDAPLTLVEFADYECPFCKSFHSKTFADLKKHYIDTGKRHFISRDLPLEFHTRALPAAEAARCAGDQGKFWEMRDALIGSTDLSSETFLKLAQTLSLDAPALRECVTAEKHKIEIQADQADAGTLQISGTPTFVLGKVSDSVLNGVVIVGAQPYEVFDTTIQQMLTAEK